MVDKDWSPRSRRSSDDGLSSGVGGANSAWSPVTREVTGEAEPDPQHAPASLIQNILAANGRRADSAQPPRSSSAPLESPISRSASTDDIYRRPTSPGVTLGLRGLCALRTVGACERDARYWENRVRLMRTEVCKADEGVGKSRVADDARARAQSLREESQRAACTLRSRHNRDANRKGDNARKAKEMRQDKMREVRTRLLQQRRSVGEERRREQLIVTAQQTDARRTELEHKLRLAEQQQRAEAELLVRKLQRRAKREEEAAKSYEDLISRRLREGEEYRRRAAQSKVQVAQLMRDLTLARQRKYVFPSETREDLL
eukprot:Hpha_TRINITY_DN2112_c0_g1::TRINITY_DN2112_c0_g1_i1::g.42352::m.42352